MPKRQENLIPFNNRTESEQREIARKGGKASGATRRKKANIKKTMEMILALDLPDGGMKEELKNMGLDTSCENGLVMSVVMRAIINGDHNALRTVQNVLDQDRTLQDRQEQKERIKRAKAETERIEEEIARKSGTSGTEQAEQQVVAIADMINTPAAERALKDFLVPEDGQGGEGDE